MASSDYPPEVSGCLVFSIEALCFLILKRLPVRSLCRFRCVCRSWNSLITSPSFVSEHFSFVASAAEKSYLLLNAYHDNRLVFPLYHPHKSPQNQVTYLDYPLQARLLRIVIVDVVHGVVCLKSYISDPEEPPIVWNPSTRKHHIIPPSHFFHFDYVRSLGFGFQSSKDDFKVVAVSYHREGLGPLVCKVFSLQSGLWTGVASDSTVGSPARLSFKSCFLNGSIHWIASFPPAQEGGKRTCAILCFDCEHDKLSEMELPREFIHAPEVIFRFGGRISVYNSHNFRFGALELWVMDKYGVVSSWNRLFRIGRPPNGSSIVMRGEDGDILVYDDVLALARETMNPLQDRKLYLPMMSGVFEESLYSIDQTSRVPRQQEEYSVYEKLA